ncbi:hypothetical protein DKX15_16445, partial [Enterococcus faecium]
MTSVAEQQLFTKYGAKMCKAVYQPASLYTAALTAARPVALAAEKFDGETSMRRIGASVIERVTQACFCASML